MPRHHGRSHKHRSKRHSSSSDEEDDETSSSYVGDKRLFVRLAAFDLVLRDVPADGNCMFYAFSDHLFGTIEKHALLRREGVFVLLNYREELLPFYEKEEFDHGLNGLAKPGTLGGHAALLALSHRYSVDVVVHRVGRRPILVFESPFHDRRALQVHLVLHRGMHYSSVRNRNNKGGPANVHIDPSEILSKTKINKTPKYHIKWHKHRSRRHSSSSDEENEDFRAQLATLGLELREVPADGNCMFHAFSDQLFGTTERHAQLRREAVDYLRGHRRELLPFCEENEFDHEVDELAKPGTFGDHTSLLALSRKYDVDVVVHQVGLNPMYAVRIPSHDRQTRQVHLAFHDMMHYSSVRCRGDIGGRANVHIDPSKILPKPKKKKKKK